MNGIIGILLVVFNVCVIRNDREKGIVLYCILILVCPVSHIWGYSLSYEWLSFPMILLLLMEKYPIIRWIYLEHLLWIVWYSWLIFVTFLTDVQDNNYINWISLIALMKYFLIFIYLGREEAVQKRFMDIICIVIVINVFAVFMEKAGSLLCSDMWVLAMKNQLYGTEGNNGALMEQMYYGKLDRFFGTFSSSAFLGILSILGFYGFIHKYMYEKKHVAVHLLVVLGAVTLGIMSSSKRFYLGLVTMGILYLSVNYIILRRKVSSQMGVTFRKLIPLLLFGGAVAVIVFDCVKDMVGGEYYLGFLLNLDFSRAFVTRFSSESGAVNPMKPYIWQYPLTGVGNITIDGVLATDSQLYLTLFHSGLVGLLIMILFFAYLFKNVVRERNLFKYLVFWTIISEFLISTTFYSSLGIIFLAYVAGHRPITGAQKEKYNDNSPSVKAKVVFQN